MMDIFAIKRNSRTPLQCILVTICISVTSIVAQAAHTNQIPFPTIEMETYMLMAETKILLSSFQLGSQGASEANMAVTKQDVDDTSIDNMEIWASTGIGLRVDGNNDVTMSNSTIKDSGGTAIPVTFNYNHDALNDAIDVAKTAIEGYAATATWDVGASTWGPSGGNEANKIKEDTTYTIDHGGLHIIDIDIDGSVSDQLLLNNNSTLTIDAPADATVIFRIADGFKLQISHAKIKMGGGIEEGSIMFYSPDDSTDTTFNFNNADLDCIAFWNIYDDSLDNADKIRFNDVTGTVQLLANQIVLQDIASLEKCAFDFHAIPEPTTIALMGFGMIGMLRRRPRRS